MAMIADVPENVLFRVLSQRIHLTNLMPCIHDVNSKDANNHLKFILADKDWRQWKVSMNFSLSSEFKPSVLGSMYDHCQAEIGILKTIICQGSGSPRPEGGLEVFEHLP